MLQNFAKWWVGLVGWQVFPHSYLLTRLLLFAVCFAVQSRQSLPVACRVLKPEVPPLAPCPSSEMTDRGLAACFSTASWERALCKEHKVCSPSYPPKNTNHSPTVCACLLKEKNALRSTYCCSTLYQEKSASAGCQDLLELDIL